MLEYMYLLSSIEPENAGANDKDNLYGVTTMCMYVCTRIMLVVIYKSTKK